MNVVTLIKKFIHSNEELVKDYSFIGVFGSVLDKKNFHDVDIITIGNSKKHKQFLLRLKDYFKDNEISVQFFETIKKKPVPERNEILIHDLHYSDLGDLLEREWIDVVNEMKRSAIVLYGSKKEIPLRKVDKKSLLGPWKDWLNEIKTFEEFDNFKEYIIKIFPLLEKLHPRLKFSDTKEKIFGYLNNKDWRTSRRDILKLLR